jgi:hypothetical protein
MQIPKTYCCLNYRHFTRCYLDDRYLGDRLFGSSHLGDRYLGICYLGWRYLGSRWLLFSLSCTWRSAV